jgi:hypothetical protein
VEVFLQHGYSRGPWVDHLTIWVPEGVWFTHLWGTLWWVYSHCWGPEAEIPWWHFCILRFPRAVIWYLSPFSWGWGCDLFSLDQSFYWSGQTSMSVICPFFCSIRRGRRDDISHWRAFRIVLWPSQGYRSWDRFSSLLGVVALLLCHS